MSTKKTSLQIPKRMQRWGCQANGHPPSLERHVRLHHPAILPSSKRPKNILKTQIDISTGTNKSTQPYKLPEQIKAPHPHTGISSSSPPLGRDGRVPEVGREPLLPGRIVVEERAKALATANEWRRRDTIWTDGSQLDSGDVGAVCGWSVTARFIQC